MNMSNFKVAIVLICMAILAVSCSKACQVNVISPDGSICIEAGVEDGKPFYSVAKDKAVVIEKSYLGFLLQNNDIFYSDFELIDTKFRSVSDEWEQPWGEDRVVKNTFNETVLLLQQKTGAKRKLNIIFRAFNDGIGFRYEFPEQESLKDFVIMDEITEFAVVGNPQSWSIPTNRTNYFENLYTKKQLTELDTVSTPLTMQCNDSLYLSIHEANLTEYGSLNLTSLNHSSTLKVDITPWASGEKVFAKTPFVSPWRTVIIARKPGELMLSRLMLNLNEPSKITDTSWIKPGRYIGIWWGMHLEKYTWGQGPKHGATTENTMRYLDFAAKHGFSGVLVEGWNEGWDGDWVTNGDQFKFTKPYPDFDIKKITDYAAKLNVKLIGHHETGGSTKNYEAQLDSAFAFCNKYGIEAVKTGYVSPLLDKKERAGSQYGVRHYRKVFETAARYKIMIDNHEPVMPTGLQRTYPNFMTQEGVRGQEYDAWSPDGGNPPSHTTIIPFTRGLAGPMDFTPGTFNFSNPAKPGTRVQTTLAKQLALAVILYSPLQMASDMIENYENNPAFAFVTSCPTTWEKTVVPDAKIGEYVVVARKDRNSENWFLGGVTNEKSREIIVKTDFLQPETNYNAVIYKDGPAANYKNNPTSVAIETLKVTSSSKLSLNMAESGGIAVEIIRE